MQRIPRDVLRTSFIFILSALGPMLDSTMVNIALNQLMLDLHTTLVTIQWGVTGYVLALAIAVPISGWLLDQYNGKRLIIWSVLAFGLFSLLTGLSWNVMSFIVFRIFQGLAAGVISTVGMSVIMRITPSSVLGRLMSIITIPTIFGPIVGPVLGGFLLQTINWRWIFFVNIPITIIAIVATIMFVPQFKPFNPDSKIDVVGIGLLSGIAFSFIYSIMNLANSINHLSPVTFGMLMLGCLLVGAYVGWNNHQKGQVILPLRFFKRRKFTAANAGLLLGSIINNGPLLILPLFFQNVRQLSPIEAALILIPQGAGMLLARPVIGRLIDNGGARPIVIMSVLITTIGTIPFAFANTTTNFVLLGVGLFVRGIGLSGVQLPMMTDIYGGMATIDIPRASVASQMIQNIGMSLGSSIASATVAIVVNLQIMTQTGLKTATMRGYQWAFIVSMIVGLIIILPAMNLSKGSDKRHLIEKSC